MDYTAFWNIVPNIAMYVLTLGMVGFTLIDYGKAYLAAQVGQNIAQPAPEVPLSAAA